MTQNKTSQGEDWGYVFYPRAYPHAPGHPRLDITIPKTPTGCHFDPVLDLYATCLETLGQKHEHTQHLIEETHQLIRFIHDEIDALKGQNLWPDKVPTLAEVL